MTSTPSPSLKRKKVAVDIFSGFCAGIGVTLVGHPFETLKVRLQTQPTGSSFFAIDAKTHVGYKSNIFVKKGPNQVYNGLIDCINKTWQWEGIRGFYKGVSSPLAGQLFFRSAMFMSNGEFIRWWSNNGTRRLSTLEYALGGSVTWTICTFIECPLQLASSQMQVDIVRQKTIPNYKPKYKNVFHFMIQNTKANGLPGLYQGLAPHLCRNIPGGAFHFGVFEATRRKWAEKKGVPVEKVGFWPNMIAGSIGGFCFWFFTYPADVVKSAMQADSPVPSERKYKGMLDCCRKLYQEGGLRRFTRGFSACALRALPANAVLLTTAARVRELGYGYIGYK